MHPAIPRLLELQHMDLRIAALRAELEAFPRRIREADHLLGGARAALAAAKETHTRALTARKKAELDTQEWRERARKFRDQSSAVKTNEAYRALQHEIANAEAEIAKAEDLQLEQMMAVEDAERGIKSAEVALKEAEQNVAAERKQIESVGREKKKEMDADVVARGKIAAEVPEELVTLYARIAKRHQGIALAEAAGDQCRACGMRVLPHTVQELHRAENHEIHTCETCGRILYALEPAAAPNSPPDAPAAAPDGSNSSDTPRSAAHPERGAAHSASSHSAS